MRDHGGVGGQILPVECVRHGLEHELDTARNRQRLTRQAATLQDIIARS